MVGCGRLFLDDMRACLRSFVCVPAQIPATRGQRVTDTTPLNTGHFLDSSALRAPTCAIQPVGRTAQIHISIPASVTPRPVRSIIPGRHRTFYRAKNSAAASRIILPPLFFYHESHWIELEHARQGGRASTHYMGDWKARRYSAESRRKQGNQRGVAPNILWILH